MGRFFCEYREHVERVRRYRNLLHCSCLFLQSLKTFFSTELNQSFRLIGQVSQSGLVRVNNLQVHRHATETRSFCDGTRGKIVVSINFRFGLFLLCCQGVFDYKARKMISLFIKFDQDSNLRYLCFSELFLLLAKTRNPCFMKTKYFFVSF